MNIDKQAFADYLRAKGYNENGIAETLKRFAEDRPDDVDLINYRGFQTTK